MRHRQFICPITLDFDSFSAASSGPNGAEYSRVAGGIHTPFAVQDALTLGDTIGGLDYAGNFQPVPEPGGPAVLGVALAGLGLVRRREGQGPRPGPRQGRSP